MAKELDRNEKAKLLIIDDSLTIRAILDELISKDKRFDIVGAAATAEEALEKVNRTLPDLITLDIGLPGLNGIEFLERIQGHWHDMKVVVVSSAAYEGSPVCDDAFERGAIACFNKARMVSRAKELVALLGEAHNGKILRRNHKGDAVILPDPHIHGTALQQVAAGVTYMMDPGEASSPYFNSTSSSAMLG